MSDKKKERKIHKKKQTNKQTDKQTDKQTNKTTDTLIQTADQIPGPQSVCRQSAVGLRWVQHRPVARLPSVGWSVCRQSVDQIHPSRRSVVVTCDDILVHRSTRVTRRSFRGSIDRSMSKEQVSICSSVNLQVQGSIDQSRRSDDLSTGRSFVSVRR